MRASMAPTLSERILARASGLKEVCAGDFVEARVNLAMAHESARLAIVGLNEIFREGRPWRHGPGLDPTNAPAGWTRNRGRVHRGRRARVWDPSRIVIILDHRAPAESEESASVHRLIRDFVREQGIRSFYDVGEGVCHQVLAEEGHVLPGTLIVGSDSHTTTHGALGAFATGIGATEMAAVWATGKIWLRVPATIKVSLRGRLGRGVTAKDAALYLVKELGAGGAEYRAIEFWGALGAMSISSRMTLCNMAVEAGAKAAMVPPDARTLAFLRAAPPGSPARYWIKTAAARRRSAGEWMESCGGSGRMFRACLGMREYREEAGEDGAVYERELELNLSSLEPQVACPHSVDNVKDIRDVEGIEIDQAFLGSCTNGSLEDLQAAARILRKRRVQKGVRLIVAPASRRVYIVGLRRGLIATLVGAGALVLSPGCGPCLGAHMGLLAPGEVCISTTSRNFRGRMGSHQAEIYLASPVTVAASAASGRITDPRRMLG
ncbi:MAG: 3-isopropylmalate dehydratase large subunit [Thermoplasmata archaeon]